MRVATLLLVAAVAAAGSCTRARTSNTARTGIEQILVSSAIDESLERTPFPPVAGRKVYLEEKYVDCVDKAYLVGSLRHRLLQEGALLMPAQDGSEITVEVRSGGVGTDDSDRFIGMPGLTVPGFIPIEIPEVRLYEQFNQFDTAKIGLVAYETTTGKLVFDCGRHLAQSDDSRWSFMGVGPFQSGSARSELATAESEGPVAAARHGDRTLR